MTAHSSVTLPSRFNRITNPLLLGPSVFFAALLIYKLVTDGRRVHLALVLTSAALALGFAGATRFSFEKKLRICLFSLSCILTVLALDLGVLVSHVGSSRELLNTRADPREKLALLSALRRSGPAYPAAIPHLLIRSNGLADQTTRVFPLAGISQAMTVLSKESGFWAQYRSDEYGFNNPPELHSGNSRSIVLIGDSFVHGASVKSGDDIAGRIRHFGRTAVNLGFWGNGPLLELATLTEYGLRLHPRAVFWVYFEGNDLTDLAEEKNSSLLRAYLEEGYSQRLAEKQNLIDQLLQQYCDAEEQKLRENNTTESPAGQRGVLNRLRQWPVGKNVRIVHLRSLLKSWHEGRRMVALGWHNPRVTDDEFRLFRNILSAAERRAKEAGAEFYFVYLPDETRFNKGLVHNRDWEQQATILSIIESLKIPCLDLEEDFSQHPDPLSLYISRSFPSHFNTSGNEFVARACLKRLEADGK